jgi:hypothetical protein
LTTFLHRKKTIENVEQFDFLKDIVAGIPDPLESNPSDETAKPTRARKPRAVKDDA